MQPTTPAVLAQIMKATQATVAMKGADDRELVLGRLLGVSALAMSGRLGSEPESAEGALKVRRKTHVMLHSVLRVVPLRQESLLIRPAPGM